MKRICIVLLVLSLGFLTLCQPTFALSVSIKPGESLWIQIDPSTDPTAPNAFDGMSFSWKATDWGTGADLDYILYGPTGYTGGFTVADLQTPSIVDLSIFEGKDVVFEFINVSTTSQSITFQDDLFKYIFFDDATPDWNNRDTSAPRQVTAGMLQLSVPAHGNKFFYHDLNFVVEGNDFPPVSIRSDFQAAPVPEPATLLLLASGIVALAGGRRKFNKK